MKHHHWTMLGNYGERFLLFHKQYVEEFNDFRISKGLRVSSWDPTTPIPARLAHDVPLMAKDELHPKGGLRSTDNPYSVDTLQNAFVANFFRWQSSRSYIWTQGSLAICVA